MLTVVVTYPICSVSLLRTTFIVIELVCEAFMKRVTSFENTAKVTAGGRVKT